MTEGYRADDRLDDDGDEDGIPAFSALVALWADRDSNYAKALTAMKPEAIEAVRAYRLKEVEDLPYVERVRAGIRVMTWWPPVHGQGRL